MTNSCPKCGKPLVGIPCFCALSQATPEAGTAGDRAEQATEQLKTSLESEVKAKEEENKQTKKAIDELLRRKLGLRTTSVGWLKTYHALAFGAYKPRAIEKEKGQPAGEIDDAPKRGLSPADIAFVSVAVIVSGVILLILWPVILLVLLIATVVFAVFYARMSFKYIKWLSASLGRSREERAVLAVQAGRLDIEIEALRVSYAAKRAHILSVKERLKEVTETSRGKSGQRSGSSSTTSKETTAGTGLLPRFEGVGEETVPVDQVDGQVPTRSRPLPVLGLMKSVANLVSVGCCPKCGLSVGVKAHGVEPIERQGRFIGTEDEVRRGRDQDARKRNGNGRDITDASPPGGDGKARRRLGEDVLDGAPVSEITVILAQKRSCDNCGNTWHVRPKPSKHLEWGACPVCHDKSKVHGAGEEDVRESVRVVGGGPDKDRFQGRSQVQYTRKSVKKFRCGGCDFLWRQRSEKVTGRWGVCPACYGERKIEILKEKVGSVDSPLKTQSSSVPHR